MTKITNNYFVPVNDRDGSFIQLALGMKQVHHLPGVNPWDIGLTVLREIANTDIVAGKPYKGIISDSGFFLLSMLPQPVKAAVMVFTASTFLRPKKPSLRELQLIADFAPALMQAAA